MGKETEIKYALATRQAWETLLGELETRFPGQWQTIQMETAYYDTPQGELAERRWTLRVRREDGRPILTCKTPLPDGNRGEWEISGGSLPRDLSRLVEQGAPRELLELTEDTLTRTCGARFTRHCRLLELPGCQVELALDCGLLLGKTRELPFQELELELKQGEEAAFRAWGRDFARQFGLQEEPRSKYARASRLP